MSPIRKSSAALDVTCNRESARLGACNVGACVPPNFIVQNGNGFPECHAPVLDENGQPVLVDPTNPDLGFVDSGNIATTYQPFTPTADLVCEQMLASVKGPTTSSWVNAIPAASLAPGATLCFNYDGAASTTTPFIAVNANRNVIAVNAFPADATDIQKFWFSCILGNTVEWLSGVRKCTVPGAPAC